MKPSSVEHKTEFRRFLFFHLGLLLTVPAFFLYSAVVQNTAFGRLLGVCALHDIWHLYCPACGMTRALHALLTLHPLLSLQANPLILFFLAVFLYCEVRTVSLYLREKVFRLYCTSRIAVVILIVFFGFAIFRNLLMVFFHVDPTGDLLPYWT